RHLFCCRSFSNASILFQNSRTARSWAGKSTCGSTFSNGMTLPLDFAQLSLSYQRRIRTRRQGDKETRRQGDKETRRHCAAPRVSSTPPVFVSLSPCLLVSCCQNRQPQTGAGDCNAPPRRRHHGFAVGLGDDGARRRLADG